MASYYPLILYLSLAACVAVRLFSSQPWVEKAEKVLLICAAVFYCLRFTIGPDLSTYIGAFNRVTSIIGDALTYDTQRNIGFNALLYIGKYWIGSYSMFVLLTNVLFWVLVGVTIWKYSRSAAISLLLLAGSGVMEVYYGNALRQSLAMAVFLFAFYRYIPKRQYWRYELWMIAAVSLHEVAAAAMLVPIVAEYVHKHPEKLLKKFIILSCIGILIGFLFIEFLPPIAQKYTWGYGPLMHAMIYFWGPDFSAIGFAMEICLGIAAMFLYYVSDQKDAFTRVQMAVFMMTLPLYFCLMGYSLASRICDFIQIIEVVLFANLLVSVPKVRMKALGFLGVVALNFVLLFVDVRSRISAVEDEYQTLGRQSNTYVFIFDPDVPGADANLVN